MEALKFKKIKLWYVVLTLAIVAILYSTSKIVAIYFYENVYFSEGRVYNPDNTYLNIPVEEKNFSNKEFIKYDSFDVNKVRFNIPKTITKDSISFKLIKADTSAILNYFIRENQKYIKKKSLIFSINDLDVSNNLKLELNDIDMGSDNSFENYELLLKHKSQKKLFFKSFKEIKRYFKLASLKYLLYTTQSEKGIYQYEGAKSKFFQFCDPSKCDNTIVNFFIRDKELTIISGGFDKDELDFILQSIDIKI
jgi:hypothetical protein